MMGVGAGWGHRWGNKDIPTIYHIVVSRKVCDGPIVICHRSGRACIVQ